MKSKNPFFVLSFLIFLAIFILKPIMMFYLGFSLAAGVILSKRKEIVISFLYGLAFIFFHILIFNVSGTNVTYLFYLNLVEFALFLFLIYRNRPQIILPDGKTLLFISCFSFFLVFKEVYFNFSDSLYHFSYLRDIITSNKFINHDPFYGRGFYDIRYSYSFYIPFLSIPYTVLLRTGMRINELTSYILNNAPVFLYFLSSLSLYFASKRCFGIISARISVFLYTSIFFFIRSSEYRGAGFSLSAYPLALCVYFLFPLLFFLVSLKEKRHTLIFSFLISGVHIFYWGLFFVVPFFDFVINRKKQDLRGCFLYLLGGIPLVLLKFHNGIDIQNSFFTGGIEFNRIYNFIFSGAGIPSAFPIVSIIVLFLFFNVFRKRKLFLVITVFTAFVSLFAPEISNIIKVNPHKLKRLYQIFPVFFVIAPALTFFFRKNKDISLILAIIILFIGTSHFFFMQDLSTYSDIPKRITKDFETIPGQSLIVSLPLDSMLVAGLTDSDVVCVPPEYSAPGVDRIKERQEAVFSTILGKENIFKADYALVPIKDNPILLESIGMNKDKRKLGGSFWLIKLGH